MTVCEHCKDYVDRVTEKLLDRDLEIIKLNQPICDCHSWPTVNEFHAYTLALERERDEWKGKCENAEDIYHWAETAIDRFKTFWLEEKKRADELRRKLDAAVDIFIEEMTGRYGHAWVDLNAPLRKDILKQIEEKLKTK